MTFDLEKLSGTVTIYRHRRSGELQVQPMCKRGKYGLAAAGYPTSVPASDDEQLALLVEKALNSFQQNTFEMDSPHLSPKEQTRFLREHDAITIDRFEDEVRFVPLEHVRGGFTSFHEAALTVTRPLSPRSLAEAVREALRRASEA
jgi:hypothetical protein